MDQEQSNTQTDSALNISFLNKYFLPMPVLEKEPSKIVENNIKRTLERKKVEATKQSPKSFSKKAGPESGIYNTGHATFPWYNEISPNVNLSNSGVNLVQKKTNFHDNQFEWQWNQPNLSSPASLPAPHPSYCQSPIGQLPQLDPPQYTSEVNSLMVNDPKLRTSAHYCQQSASNGQQPTLQYLPQTPASEWNCSPLKEMMSMSQNLLPSNLQQESNMQQPPSQNHLGYPDSGSMSLNYQGKDGSLSSQRIAQNMYNQSQSSDYQFPNQKLHPLPLPFHPHAINSLPIASQSNRVEQHTPRYPYFNNPPKSSFVDRPNWRYLPPHYNSLHTLKQASQCSAFPSDTYQQPQQVNRAHHPLLKPDGHNNLPQQMLQDYHHQQPQQQPRQEVPAYSEMPLFEHRTTIEKQLRQVPVPQPPRSNEYHFPINYQPYCCALNNESGSNDVLVKPSQECQNLIKLSSHHKNALHAYDFLRQSAQQQQCNYTRQHRERDSVTPLEFDGQAKEQPNHHPQLHNNQLEPSIRNHLSSDHQFDHLTQQHFYMQNKFVSDQVYKQQAARQSYLERFQKHRRQTELPHISNGEDWLQELIEGALNIKKSCPAGKNGSDEVSSKSKISTNNQEVGKSNKGEKKIENFDVGIESALKINATKSDCKTQPKKMGRISKKGNTSSKDASKNKGKPKTINTKSKIDQNISLVDVLFQESVNLQSGIHSLQKKQLNKHEQEKYVSSFDSNNNQPNGRNSTNEGNSPQIEHITVEWISDGDAQEKDEARQRKLFEYFDEDQAVCGMEFEMDIDKIEEKLSNEVLNENVTDKKISCF